MEKGPSQNEVPASSHDVIGEEAGGMVDRPRGWKYRSIGVGPVRTWYASPGVQLVIVSLVCFLCPGMFNANNGMGGGGQVDPRAGNDANVACYSTFAVVGFFAGTFTNYLGVRKALCFGGIGYSVYIGSFLSYSHHNSYGFSVFAGTLLGICAGILWSAQGQIMMAYPPEGSKGRYIAWFWMIFNMGAVIGGLIPLGQNIHVKSNSTVTDGTYIGFIVLTVIGAALAWAMVSAKDVIRHDGSKVILMKNPTWKTEIVGLWEVFRTDTYIVLLFPMFFASNWFYTYHFNDVNLAKFNTRTRALNTVLYYTMQIVGALIFGYLLDRKLVSRPTRAKICWGVLFVLTFAIWGGGYAFQKGYTRAEVTKGDATKDDTSDDYVKLDWSDSGYIGPMFLYMFYGFYDSVWQTCVYWFMGSLTNNGRKLANFAGFYKGIQSAGAAIIWRVDNLNVPYWNIYGSSFGLLAGSLLFALPVIWTKVKDHVDIEEDLQFTDETIEDVAPRTSVDMHGKQTPLA